jgi:hypothetical protein
MVDSLDPGDDFSQCGIVQANVIDEFGFCICRSGNEDGTGVCNRFGHGLKIVVIRGCVAAADRVCLVMNVLGRMVGMQDQSFDIRRIEMEHAGFTMINPDNGMIMRIAHRCVLYDPHFNSLGSKKLLETGLNRSLDVSNSIQFSRTGWCSVIDVSNVC